jgi:flagellar basal-body rod protein FlgC
MPPTATPPDLFTIAASGLTASRLRLAVASDNLANADSTAGTPYQDLVVNLAAAPVPTSGPDAGIGAGVEVTGIVPLAAPPLPGVGPAGSSGAAAPDVSLVANLTDIIDAQSSYSANATAFTAAKTLDMKALTL